MKTVKVSEFERLQPSGGALVYRALVDCDAGTKVVRAYLRQKLITAWKCADHDIVDHKRSLAWFLLEPRLKKALVTSALRDGSEFHFGMELFTGTPKCPLKDLGARDLSFPRTIEVTVPPHRIGF